MNKREAFDLLEKSSTIEDQFEAAYNILKHSPPISQDKMLLLYAYYKQALFGDFKKTEENQVSNYIQTFKNNAWIQVNGMKAISAKEKYIEFTKELIKSEYPE